MAEFYKQEKGVLVKLDDTKWVENNKLYRYGSLNKMPYYSDSIPKCNLCGSELKFMKKGKYALILGCLNEKCETNTDMHGKSTRLEAFLPKEYFEKILLKRKENFNSYFDKTYLMDKKGLTEAEAEEYINLCKQNISERNKGKNKEYYISKYGQKWLEKLNNVKKYRKNCIEFWLEKGLTEEESKRKVSEYQSEVSKLVKQRPICNKEYFINKFGEEASDIFFKERSYFCLEYWLKHGLTEEEAKSKISELQSKNSKQRNNYVSNKTINYWIERGLTEEEAKSKISELQSTFSKEKCIKKYGEERGLEIWKERQQKWQMTLHKNNNLHVGYSKVSQELFQTIESLYDEEDRDYLFYGSKNHEFVIKYNKHNFVYDFVDLKQRKIIEFNGDVYHGNPKMFKSTDKPHPFNKLLTAEDIWKRDELKKEVAEKEGFKEIIIWEDDYKNDQERVINECKNFLLCKI